MTSLIEIYVAASGFIDLDCQIKNGETYRGSVSITREGLKCKTWKDAREFTYLGSSNHCRNPGSSDHHLGGAWCFTADDKGPFIYDVSHLDICIR